MGKKTLDASAMVNELRGQSAFFRDVTADTPASPTSSPATATTGSEASRREELVQKSERPTERANERPFDRTVGKPQRRIARRYSFEFYDDQIAKLKSLKHQAEAEGEWVSLSQMVRDAIDQYLKSR